MSTSTIFVSVLGAASAFMFFYLLRFKASAKHTNRDNRIDWLGARPEVHESITPADQSANVDKPSPEALGLEDRTQEQRVVPKAMPSSAPVEASSPRINKWLIAAGVVLVAVVLLSFYENTNT